MTDTRSIQPMTDAEIMELRAKSHIYSPGGHTLRFIAALDAEKEKVKELTLRVNGLRAMLKLREVQQGWLKEWLLEIKRQGEIEAEGGVPRGDGKVRPAWMAEAALQGWCVQSWYNNAIPKDKVTERPLSYYPSAEDVP